MPGDGAGRAGHSRAGGWRSGVQSTGGGGGQYGSPKALAKVGIKQKSDTWKPTHSRGLSGHLTALRALPWAEARPALPAPGVPSVFGKEMG